MLCLLFQDSQALVYFKAKLLLHQAAQALLCQGVPAFGRLQDGDSQQEPYKGGVGTQLLTPAGEALAPVQVVLLLVRFAIKKKFQLIAALAIAVYGGKSIVKMIKTIDLGSGRANAQGGAIQ